jgi:hypothetical protein
MADTRAMLHRAGCVLAASLLGLLPAPRLAEA